MSETNAANHPILLALKGQVIVYCTNGDTLAGKYETQDAYNIFIKIDDEPVMISRSQIKYIKGAQGQAIQEDTSHNKYLPDRTEIDTIKSSPVQVTPAASKWDTDISGLKLDADTPQPDQMDDDATVFFEEDDLLAEDDATLLLEEEDDEDETFFIETEDEESETESTLVGQELDDVFEESEEDETFKFTAYLDCTAGPHAGQRFNIQPGTTTIGRSNDNVFPLSSDKEVSRRHALITEQADGTFVIEDRNSLNGVIVNDIRIESPHPLSEGDSLLIGQCVMEFHNA